MKASEVAELLILDAGLNRYASAGNQSREKAVAWAAALNLRAPQLGFGEARELIVEHYAGTSEPLTPYALIEAWERKHRLLPHQVAADVRSARARGMLPAGHEPREPLPAVVAEQLAAARAMERAAMEVESLPWGTRREIGNRK